MVAAGLVAKKANERGMKPKPWVKTSLAPGSQVVTDYLAKAGLQDHLDAVGYNLVGYGCTTCIGNSGPLAAPISEAINGNNIVAAAVLSGNRNFEGRVSPDVRANYRSEEHTSELQSLTRISYAVFCLKKKKTTKQKVT